jgi:hypothetical protein
VKKRRKIREGGKVGEKRAVSWRVHVPHAVSRGIRTASVAVIYRHHPFLDAFSCLLIISLLA